MTVLIVVLLTGGFYSYYWESSPTIQKYLGGAAFVAAGILIKSLSDFFVVSRREKELKTKVLKDLLKECTRNLELIESNKIRWPQVHFDVISFETAGEKTALSSVAPVLHTQIVESYQLVSEIEKRKFSAFDKKTDKTLEKLAAALPTIIEELEKRIQN